MSRQSARYERSAGGLVGAMVALVLLVVGWEGISTLLSPDEATPVATVDYERVAPQFRKVADFDLTVPSRLPDGWRATTVSFTDGPHQHWHLGVLTDEGRYVGLEQGDESVATMVEASVDEAAARGGPVDVAGQSWASYTDPGGDLGLAHRAGRTTTLVVGHEVSRAALVSYAESLRSPAAS